MKAFFEACCLLTITLLTFFGKLSISLWDLHSLVGLTLTESLYDEVSPSFEELTSVDQTNNRFIPRSCKYLFQAYHLLRKNTIGGQFSKVSLEMWISSWSKKDMKYRQLPSRMKKKKTCPKSTHNPSSNFDVHQEWTAIEETLFLKLGLDRRLRDETYLAAYLACWLCTFVFPIDDVGSLVIPVLASIYKGLNKVSNSPRPTRVNYPFPVHFIYFCHQFGYYQEVPRVLRRDFCQADLEDGLHYW
ncbi:hypothetical protein CDL12_22080 [Handroanthus impetiginosus]|uniref:Aminotransferase-like plant mobile domain-containing protein n=1 Tax=Handroanthus impetiginosus TaxID=429701 RepID=A0A2G9GJE9_9LAMI|nr:hypothetical protein CDL12_22080 [Handroanthus impetiginosus]